MLKNFCLCSGQYCDIISGSPLHPQSSKSRNRKRHKSKERRDKISKQNDPDMPHYNKNPGNAVKKKYYRQLVNSNDDLQKKKPPPDSSGIKKKLKDRILKASSSVVPVESSFIELTDSYSVNTQPQPPQQFAINDYDYISNIVCLSTCPNFDSNGSSSITTTTTSTTNSIHFYHPKSIHSIITCISSTNQKNEIEQVKPANVDNQIEEIYLKANNIEWPQSKVPDEQNVPVVATLPKRKPSRQDSNMYESIESVRSKSRYDRIVKPFVSPAAKNLSSQSEQSFKSCMVNISKNSSCINNTSNINAASHNEEAIAVNVMETCSLSGQEILYVPDSVNNSLNNSIVSPDKRDDSKQPVINTQTDCQEVKKSEKSVNKLKKHQHHHHHQIIVRTSRSSSGGGGGGGVGTAASGSKSKPSESNIYFDLFKLENKCLRSSGSGLPTGLDLRNLKRIKHARKNKKPTGAEVKQPEKQIDSESVNQQQQQPSTPINTEIVAKSISSSESSNKNNSQQVNSTPLTDSNTMAAVTNESLEKLINRLESVTNRLESFASTSSSSGKPTTNGAANVVVEEAPQSVLAFDELIDGTFQQFKDLSAKCGSDVKTMSDLVEKAFRAQRGFLLEAVNCVQPSQADLGLFFQEFSKNIQDVQSFREKNRKSDVFNHLSAISESIGALGWIAVSPAPAPYVKEMNDSATFYTNRVLKDFKDKDANHVNWAKTWLQLLTELQAYVKQYHTTGVSWNSTRQARKFDPSRKSQTNGVHQPNGSGPAGPAPPPPPPPMPNFADLLADDSSSKSAKPSNDALFAEINRGADITKGLKKISDDQKTHKNPNLRAGAIVPGGSATSSASSTSTVKAPAAVNKPPVLELVDKKWKVEFQQGRGDLLITETDLKQAVYVYQCRDCTLTVKGKVNSILLDSCSKVGLLFDDVLSTVEFINCKSVQMQVLGRVPTVAIEKTDGCQVYLSKNSMDTEVISSKSSSMNVLIPSLTEENDYIEMPVPEQYKTVIDTKTRKLQTTPNEIV